MAELEQTIEEKLIIQLTQGKSQWTYRPDLTDENKLWNNIRQILERGNKEQLDGQPLTDRDILVLPSTSPANAAWSLDRLYEKWSEILR